MTEGVLEKWEDARSAASRLTGIFLIAENAMRSKKARKRKKLQNRSKRRNQKKAFAKFAESRQEDILCATSIQG